MCLNFLNTITLLMRYFVVHPSSTQNLDDVGKIELCSTLNIKTTNQINEEVVMTMNKVDFKDLNEKLKKAAGREMSADKIREQKISFIMGTLSKNNTITRKEVEEMIDKKAGISSKL